MKTMNRIVSLVLVTALMLGMFPGIVSAKQEAEDCVYLSVSFDGEYIDDQYGEPMVYLPIALDDIAAIDLEEYGLENMLFDADDDGEYEITALQLLIYAHEELYGGSWDDVNFDALPGSSYFRGGIFDFTENLVYFHNGDFPVDETQESDYMTVGATSDRIVLEAGDFLDVASFSCFSFLWDQAGGFHLFADEDGEYVHDYFVDPEETFSVKLMHSFCDLMFGIAWVIDAADYEVFYGTEFGEAEGSVLTDDSGFAELCFDEAGAYYLWCNGDNGSDDGTHTSCDYYSETGEPCIVSAPAYAKVTVGDADEQPSEGKDEEDEDVFDVSDVLEATLAQLADTVTEPTFGTNAGEWTVFCLARGNYFSKNSDYFADYYDRIVDIVNDTAESVNLNGALDKNKSTDNSRLIVALSAIGKDATDVGDWDLVEPYSENGINWIKKQGMNGTIWTLIALDSNDYATADRTIRQQCVDSILAAQHDDGGWSLVTSPTTTSNVDITAMALVALYPYRDQPEVEAACEEAFAWLSDVQLPSGGFPYGTGETSESCAWAIVACTTWGINPDSDIRFIKNGNSAVENLLSYYLEDEAMFAHQGGVSNNMATDQACYALIAYDRLINDEPALFDYSDVNFDRVWDDEEDEDDEDDEEEEDEDEDENLDGDTSLNIKATLGLPAAINPNDAFRGILSIDNWSNDEGYKLIDFIISVPSGITVTDVSAANRLSGGSVSYHLEKSSGKLRVVYFDANRNSDLTISGTQFPAEVFNISMQANGVPVGRDLTLGIAGMSVKKSSDSSDESAMTVINTDSAYGSVDVVSGISFSAVCLYEGDDVDLIPSTKKAVAVAVTGIEKGTALTYKTDGVEFRYSKEISDKTGVSTYIALVSADMDMTNFVNSDNYTLGGSTAETITFGDSNADGVVNAQDALAAVDAWFRKGDEPTDLQILTMNVNGDSRINTFDALGIVEAFVDGSPYGIVTKAATVSTKQ